MERHRVLIVDDDDDLRALLAATLGSKFEVVEAYDGLDALNRLEEYEPDLAILDMELPVMDGLELCRSIRGKIEYRDMSVLFLSGHSNRADMLKGYAAGANLFLAKPIEPFFHCGHDRFVLRQLHRFDRFESFGQWP